MHINNAFGIGRPQPRSSRQQPEPSFLKSAKQRGSLIEDDENENSDDELSGAYTRQLQQQQRQSPIQGK